jgi:NitT/TauT family transport system ATP-binding protein
MDIIVSDLSKSYGSNLVLDQFSAVFRKHRISCVMGPSGCGKTTLLNILLGLLQPDGGKVTGVPKLKSAVFQEDRLCESFNSISNVRLVCGKRANKNLIVSHLENIGLKGSLDKPVSELSGGMKRRVAVVRAVFAQSNLLVLDEPLKGLDSETKKLTIQYIKDNIKNRTVIMVTHSIDEVQAFEGELIMLRRI